MISDQERRDIAEGLRNLKGECVPLAYVLDELGVDCDGADVPKAHVKRLADLIDRPTCRNEASGLFICSKCGECVSAERKIPGSLNVAQPYIPDYCPCCGAKVVAEDD